MVPDSLREPQTFIRVMAEVCSIIPIHPDRITVLPARSPPLEREALEAGGTSEFGRPMLPESFDLPAYSAKSLQERWRFNDRTNGLEEIKTNSERLQYPILVVNENRTTSPINPKWIRIKYQGVEGVRRNLPITPVESCTMLKVDRQISTTVDVRRA